MRRIIKKWRPPLVFVLGGTLAAVLTLPILGIVNLRLWGNVMGWGEAAWLIAWIAVVATAVLGFLLWRLVLRPVWSLDRYAQEVRKGARPDAPTHLGTPEFMGLASSVMGMGDSLQSRADGLQAYADHVTHELKSPLTAIRGAAELLQAGASGADAKVLSNTITDASARMQNLLDDLARHAHAATSAGPGTVRLSDAVESLKTDVALNVETDGMLPISAEDLKTILTQLAGNAAAHGANKLSLRVSVAGLDVWDDGPGISPGNRDRIFDPFFTTRRERGGTGMGLNIVRSLVQARGGQIALQEEGEGARFLITFE
ncbi:HAMP domain-containing sensor histidine kinase [uncultured Tateyamaria sp.]|uniref:sensor histidine kinase n=1 Tax=uncultured Tateyamaria sp. TaxID=455651 RepID=UPI00260D5302|nr:HAMP domain-containing sensor histidine kinase [uncultured Tateyamaria sp.]